VPFRELTNAGQLRWLIDNRIVDAMPPAVDPVALAEVEEKALDLLDKIKEMMSGNGDAGGTAGTIKREIALALTLPGLEAIQPAAGSDNNEKALSYLISGPQGRLQLTGGEPYTWGTLLCWIFACHLGEMVSTLNSREISRTWIDEWLLTKIMAAGLVDLGLTRDESEKALMLTRLMTSHADWYEESSKDPQAGATLLQIWLKDTDFQRFLQINRYQDILWYNREAFDELLWWLNISSLVTSAREIQEPEEIIEAAEARYAIIKQLLAAQAASGYQVEKLLAAVKNLQ